MKTLTKIIIALAISVAAYGQVTLSTTTLGAAITSTTQTSITLASTSTMQNQGPGNQINTVLYFNKELDFVVSVTDSTHVVVQRAKGIGAAGRPTLHASGTKVFFANTSGPNAAPIYFSVLQPDAENFGSCTANTLLALPRIYEFSGDIADCKRTGAAGTSGQWIQVGNGTMGSAGQRISGFCTGTVGSAETEFLNGAACSGATTATARQLITTAGTLANLQIVSSANSLGTGGTIASVVLNGTATAIVCSIAAAAKVCSDTTHSVAVVPGDVITFSYLTSTSDTAANIGAAVGLY